ncbi:MAG: hypothetical protein EBT07_19185, partial [Actinobacteria bacterium]|nr:hypothetical protein [Actinomycetota bacterium]
LLLGVRLVRAVFGWSDKLLLGVRLVRAVFGWSDRLLLGAESQNSTLPKIVKATSPTNKNPQPRLLSGFWLVWVRLAGEI